MKNSMKKIIAGLVFGIALCVANDVKPMFGLHDPILDMHASSYKQDNYERFFDQNLVEKMRDLKIVTPVRNRVMQVVPDWTLDIDAFVNLFSDSAQENFAKWFASWKAGCSQVSGRDSQKVTAQLSKPLKTLIFRIVAVWSQELISKRETLKAEYKRLIQALNITDVDEEVAKFVRALEKSEMMVGSNVQTKDTIKAGLFRRLNDGRTAVSVVTKTTKNIAKRFLPYVVTSGAFYVKCMRDITDQSARCAMLCGNGQFTSQVCDTYCNVDTTQYLVAAGLVATVAGVVTKIGLNKMLPLFDEQYAD